jgi:hypothetical protein
MIQSLHDLIDKLTSGDIPTGTMGAIGIILFLFAVKAGKGFIKLVFVVLALAAFAGAVCWHLHKQGKL